MSRPTVSASSIGPIGMPNASAASSIVSGAMPSSTARIAAIEVRREHAVDEEPGRALHGQRQLVDLAHERRRLRHQRLARLRADHDLDQHHARDRD